MSDDDRATKKATTFPEVMGVFAIWLFFVASSFYIAAQIGGDADEAPRLMRAIAAGVLSAAAACTSIAVHLGRKA